MTHGSSGLAPAGYVNKGTKVGRTRGTKSSQGRLEMEKSPGCKHQTARAAEKFMMTMMMITMTDEAKSLEQTGK